SHTLWGPPLGMLLSNRDVRTGRAIVPEGAPPDEGPRLTGEALWNQARPGIMRAGQRLQDALAGTTASASPYARAQTPGQALSQGLLDIPLMGPRGARPDLAPRDQAAQSFTDQLERGYRPQ